MVGRVRTPLVAASIAYNELLQPLWRGAGTTTTLSAACPSLYIRERLAFRHGAGHTTEELDLGNGALSNTFNLLAPLIYLHYPIWIASRDIAQFLHNILTVINANHPAIFLSLSRPRCVVLTANPASGFSAGKSCPGQMTPLISCPISTIPLHMSRSISGSPAAISR